MSRLVCYLQQVQQAMRVILSDLTEEDRFNVFAFNSGVKSWTESFTPVTDATIQEAKQWVNSLDARGGQLCEF
jgi:hypothetical protein